MYIDKIDKRSGSRNEPPKKQISDLGLNLYGPARKEWIHEDILGNPGLCFEQV